jgi:peroxiredoxin
VPCRREIPLLRQLRRERHAQGVEIVGIAVDFADSVQKYVKDIGLDYPLMIGEEDGLAAAESFGMDLVLPFTVFADAERRIVAVKVGELHADEARLILDAVQQINAKTVDIVAAKADIAAKMREMAAERAVAAAAPKS